MEMKERTHANIFLDLESLPEKDSFTFTEPSIDEVGEHGSLKDPIKIEEWKAKKFEELKQKAKDEAEKEWRSESLVTYKGRVLCIAYAINDGEVKCIDARGGEKEMLIAFYEDIKDYKTISFIGHNLQGFDLLFLLHRCFHYKLFDLANILRVDHGYTAKRDWDTSEMASGGLSWKYRISLHNLCKLLGVPTSKDDINGSEVLDAYLRGEIDRICAYCKKDTDRTRKCFYILK